MERSIGRAKSGTANGDRAERSCSGKGVEAVDGEAEAGVKEGAIEVKVPIWWRLNLRGGGVN